MKWVPGDGVSDGSFAKASFGDTGGRTMAKVQQACDR